MGYREDKGMANANIKISLRSLDRYELEKNTITTCLANCQKQSDKLQRVWESGAFHNVGAKWSVLFFRAVL